MKINLPHLVKLANITIKKTEEEKLEKQLLEILEYVKKLNEVDTKNVLETHQVTNLQNKTREDKEEESIDQDKALMNAKKVKDGKFVVNAIFEDK